MDLPIPQQLGDAFGILSPTLGNHDLFLTGLIQTNRRQEQSGRVAFERLQHDDVRMLHRDHAAIELLTDIAVNFCEVLREKGHQIGRKRITKQNHTPFAIRIALYEMNAVDLDLPWPCNWDLRFDPDILVGKSPGREQDPCRHIATGIAGDSNLILIERSAVHVGYRNAVCEFFQNSTIAIIGAEIVPVSFGFWIEVYGGMRPLCFPHDRPGIDNHFSRSLTEVGLKHIKPSHWRVRTDVDKILAVDALLVRRYEDAARNAALRKAFLRCPKLCVDAFDFRRLEAELAARIRHGRGRSILIVRPEHPTLPSEHDVTVKRTMQQADMEIRAGIDQGKTEAHPVCKPEIECTEGARGKFLGEGSPSTDGDIPRTEPWPVIAEQNNRQQNDCEIGRYSEFAGNGADFSYSHVSEPEIDERIILVDGHGGKTQYSYESDEGRARDVVSKLLTGRADLFLDEFLRARPDWVGEAGCQDDQQHGRRGNVRGH